VTRRIDYDKDSMHGHLGDSQEHIDIWENENEFWPIGFEEKRCKVLPSLYFRIVLRYPALSPPTSLGSHSRCSTIKLRIPDPQ
jgi:hypothetical protein